MAVELLATMTGTDPASMFPERAIEQKANRLTVEYESFNGVQQASVCWTEDHLEIDLTLGGRRLSPAQPGIP